MKNKKIFLLTVLFLGTTFSQKLSAMNFLKKVPIVSSISAYMDAKKLINAYKAYNEARESLCSSLNDLNNELYDEKSLQTVATAREFINKNPIQPPSDSVRSHLKTIFKREGVDVFFPRKSDIYSDFGDEESKRQLSNGSIVTIGKQSVLSLNPFVIDQLENGKYDDVMGTVLHELGHAVHRHTEKKLTLKVTATSLLYSGIYADHSAAIDSYMSYDYKVQSLIISSLILKLFLVHDSVLPLIQNFYSRRCERQADQYVMQNASDGTIEKMENEFKKIMVDEEKHEKIGILEKVKSLFCSHPTHKERADAFAAELARRQVARE